MAADSFQLKLEVKCFLITWTQDWSKLRASGHTGASFSNAWKKQRCISFSKEQFVHSNLSTCKALKSTPVKIETDKYKNKNPPFGFHRTCLSGSCKFQTCSLFYPPIGSLWSGGGNLFVPWAFFESGEMTLSIHAPKEWINVCVCFSFLSRLTKALYFLCSISLNNQITFLFPGPVSVDREGKPHKSCFWDDLKSSW